VVIDGVAPTGRNQAVLQIWEWRKPQRRPLLALARFYGRWLWRRSIRSVKRRRPARLGNHITYGTEVLGATVAPHRLRAPTPMRYLTPTAKALRRYPRCTPGPLLRDLSRDRAV
jgi:hypothetical protein